jgi:lipoprotein-releasing system permease protein
MELPYELFIAFRYLLARRKQAFISLISLISVLGVTIGVMALLIALALMTGLQGELRDRLVGSTAHVYVFKAGGIHDANGEIQKLLRVPRVVGAAPVVQGKAIVSSNNGGTAFIDIKGIVPDREKTVTQIAAAMQAGSLDALIVRPDESDGILIGRDLAKQLNVFIGEKVSVMSPEGGTLSPFGLMGRSRSFKVVGIFSLGLYEFDNAYGFVRLDVAERLLDKSHPDYIEVRVDDMFAAGKVADSIVDHLGPEYAPQDWSDMNRSLFSALWLEKMAISITIGLIVMVAALNIVASLVLLVMEKSHDIAILKTMGSSAASIRRIFMLQGLIIGLVGTGAGAFFGGMLIFILDRFKLIHVPLDVYQISYVPFTLQPLDFVIVVAAAVLICFVATIYPSRQASKLDPAQALRYG